MYICSDDDSEEEEQRAKKKNIPDWAKGENLQLSLRRQFAKDSYIDPDTIFPPVTSINLDGALYVLIIHV